MYSRLPPVCITLRFYITLTGTLRVYDTDKPSAEVFEQDGEPNVDADPYYIVVRAYYAAFHVP